MSTVDHAPARVSVDGEERAGRARVVWRDGTLYVFTDRSQSVFTGARRPQRSRGTWRTSTSDGNVSWSTGGCRCGCKVCRKPREQLIASAQGATD